MTGITPDHLFYLKLLPNHWIQKKRRGESSTSLTITSNGRQIGIEGGRERGTAGEEYSLEKASPFFTVARWQANHANEYRLGKQSGEGVYWVLTSLWGWRCTDWWKLPPPRSQPAAAPHTPPPLLPFRNPPTAIRERRPTDQSARKKWATMWYDGGPSPRRQGPQPTCFIYILAT